MAGRLQRSTLVLGEPEREGKLSRRRFVELYVVPSWEEHLRQHADRLTGADERFEEEVDAFSHPPPETSHLIEAEFPEE